MGYHAPKAQEVYRYLFRINQREDITLSDGFSWSILFINDSSSLCRDFLLKYGAELSHRTADRIRFVFFSNTPEVKLEQSEDAAYRAGGFFSYIIDQFVSKWREAPNYDLEREDYDALRPEALQPLDTQEDIDRQISFEAELYGAMPGSSEAHRLAQTLGIGRFVPAFLLFTDVGDPTVRLFPIARKTPGEVYERLRAWIDSFYEVNQRTLAEWSAIEESIKQTVNRIDTSLREVANWRERQKKPWDELQTVSRYLDRMANSAADIDLLDDFRNEQTVSHETWSLVSPFFDRLNQAVQKQIDARRVDLRLNNARTIRDPRLLRDQLLKFKETYRGPVSLSISARLSETIKTCDPVERPPSPKDELYSWWRSEFGKPTSRNRYEKYRFAWVHYSKDKYGIDAVGSVAKIIKEEFDVVRQAALQQPVFRSPTDAAQEVIVRLAGHLDVDPEDRAWLDSVSDYHRILTDHFTYLQQYAPTWLMNLASEFYPQVRWEDCVPVEDAAPRADRRALLNERRQLQQLLERATNKWEEQIRQAEADRQERVLRSAAQLFAAIDESLESVKLLNADKAAIWTALLANLLCTRQELEKRTSQNALAVRGASYPGHKVSELETRELLGLLDRYDRAIRSIKYAFDVDPEVLTVSLQTSLIEASGIDNASDKNLAQQVGTRLRNLAKNSATSVRDWESLQHEAQSWSPAGKLWTAMNKVLSRRTVDEALKNIGARDLSDGLTFLTARGKNTSVTRRDPRAGTRCRRE